LTWCLSILESPRLKENMRKSFARTVKVGKDGLDDVEISYMTLEDIDDVMVVEKLSFTIPWSKNALIEEVLNNRMAIYITAKVNGKAIGYAGMWKILMKVILQT